MGTILQDVRFGLRMLAKHQLATLVSILALAVGIGANTAMFSLAEAFLLHPAPFENADRIVALVDSRPQENIDMNGIAPATYFDWQKEVRSFDRLAAYAWQEVNLTGDGNPQKVNTYRISANLFETLGVQPLLGRGFFAEEEEPGKDQRIVLGHALWEQRYASDPQILGKDIKVDGKSYTVLGVMGKGFDFPLPAEAWLPLAIDVKDRERRDSRWLFVLGRLKQHVSFSEASAEMQAIAQREADAYPDTDKGWRLRPMPLTVFVTGTLTREYTWLLMGAVGFVLLIACADVANVQFARVAGRTNEFAVRAALGGSRWRVIRQLLIESIVLAACGAVCGLFIAQWALQVTLSHMPPNVARFIAGWKTIRLDSNAFLFTLAIVAVSGVLSGIFPSLLASRENLAESLKESGRGSTSSRARGRLRGALVVAEISLALVLLVGAGLLVKNFQGLLNVNESYSPRTLLTMNLTLPRTQYATQPQQLAFFEQVLQRLNGLPGVQSAAIVTHVPYSEGGGVEEDIFSIREHPASKRGERQDAIVQNIAPSYFRMMNIALRDGRFLSDADGANTTKVVVISESLARRCFPGENPMGKHLSAGRNPSDTSDNDVAEHPWWTIVGVVSDVHYSWISKEEIPTIYGSFRQWPPYYTTIMVRAASDPTQLVSAVHTEIAALDPELPLYNIKPMDRVITESIIGIAYVAAMMAVLGVIALILASVGVFGVMSYSVSERVHEIGVRLSLGAQTGDIVRMVLRSGMLLTILGLVIGLPVAFVLARALASLLFGVEATDPFSFIGLPLLLAAVAALASYLPARRASRVDPLVALRYE
ncbi:MAG TPA: ABC transporter permease [Candidatus Acidoferrum sp.]|nr:ABC transporter permease [Candidatus Acidoferrum sp.]